MLLDFGEYLPDIPAFNNPGATVIKNAIPMGGSYESFPSMDVYSNALTARPQGAAAFRDTDGTVYNFAGDATKLYKLTQAVWGDVSRLAGGAYTIGAEERWEFGVFGRRVMAVNANDATQSFVMGTSTNFAALGGSPPKARHIGVVKDFVVLGNVNDGTAYPYRVQWSALGDPTASWATSSATLADYQDLDNAHGWVKRVVGGEYGTIFQEKAITRMTFVGSPLAFQFDTIETGRGTQAPGSVVKFGNNIFYLGLDGFYVFNGQYSEPIGANKVDKTFFADLDANYLNRIYAVADLRKKIIYLAYPAVGNTGGRPNKIMMWNYSPTAKKRWSYAEIDTECMFNSYAEGYTLDTLDTLNSSLDDLPYSLDSLEYTGGAFVLSAFDSLHQQNNFTGTALTALLETSEGQPFPGQRSEVLRTRPLVDGGSTVTLQCGTRNKLTESATYAAAVTLNTQGFCPVRANAHYHRYRVNVSGGFTHAQGVEILEATATGAR